MWARAPGRVNLVGDHTDYADGFVLPLAIDRVCEVTAQPGSTGAITASSAALEGTVTVPPDGQVDMEAVQPRWGRFVTGVVRAVADRAAAAGRAVPPLDLRISSTVPPGSGLSSSSALSVALTLVLGEAADLDLPPDDLARTALAGEVYATGVPGGLMDQLTAVHGVAGHALLIDTRSLDITPIPLPGEIAVLVAHSGVERTLAATGYADRRAATDAAAARLGVAALRDATPEQVADDPRARHVVSENARVLACAEALRAGDVDAVGSLLVASHVSLRDDFKVSTPELDALVESFLHAGALGARLTGAGFGGCVVAIARRADVDAVTAEAAHEYTQRTGRDTAPFEVRASNGATSSRGARPSSARTPPV